MRLSPTATPKQRLLLSAIRAGLFAATVHSGITSAATITVTDGGDSGTASTCTLRQAIESANTDSAGTSSCTAGSGADTIAFGTGITSITLGASGELMLTDANQTTISGGTGVTIDGNNASRIFHVAIGAMATFDHLTVQHGKVTHADGAGILCEGTLAVTDSTITGNTSYLGNGGGLGVYPSCSATLTNTTMSGNTATYVGGGTKTSGTLVLAGSTVSGNTAANGGGIDSLGQLTATDTTISGNMSSKNGGGVSATAGQVSFTRVSLTGNTAALHGAGLNSLSSNSFNLVNSTISGNSSPYGAAIYIFTSGTGTLTNCTVYGNIPDNYHNAIGAVSGSVTLINTIVANTASHFNCPGAGSVIDGGGNLDDGTTCGFGLTSLSNTNPVLGPLADNGGLTLTLLPQPGSPAIDAITCTNAPADDQRGVPRPQGPQCDIGAVEAGLTLSVTDNSLFGFYGNTVLYIVTLENKSASLAATGVHISAFGSAALNDPGTLWFCTVGNCTTTATSGPLDDTATIPASASLTWLVSVPVFENSNESTATLTVSASGAGTTSDTDTLAIFRDTFD